MALGAETAHGWDTTALVPRYASVAGAVPGKNSAAFFMIEIFMFLQLLREKRERRRWWS